MIRKAELKDLSTIVEFNHKMAKETEDLELNVSILEKGVLKAIQEETKAMYFVYEEHNKIIGQMMITKEWSDWRNADFWWIQSVYVHENHRRKKVFKKMFEYVHQLTKETPGVCGLRLYVEKENQIAKQTYTSLGMKETYYLLYELEN